MYSFGTGLRVYPGAALVLMLIPYMSNHGRYRRVDPDSSDFDAWMSIGEHAKDLIGKTLTHLLYIFEAEFDLITCFKISQKLSGLRTGHILGLDEFYHNVGFVELTIMFPRSVS